MPKSLVALLTFSLIAQPILAMPPKKGGSHKGRAGRSSLPDQPSVRAGTATIPLQAAAREVAQAAGLRFVGSTRVSFVPGESGPQSVTVFGPTGLPVGSASVGSTRAADVAYENTDAGKIEPHEVGTLPRPDRREDADFVPLMNFDVSQIVELSPQLLQYINMRVDQSRSDEAGLAFFQQVPLQLITMLMELQALDVEQALRQYLAYQPQGAGRAATLIEIQSTPVLLMALDPGDGLRHLLAYQLLARLLDPSVSTRVFGCGWVGVSTLLHATFSEYLIARFPRPPTRQERIMLCNAAFDIIDFISKRITLPLSSIVLEGFEKEDEKPGQLREDVLLSFQRATESRRVITCGCEGLPWINLRGYGHREDSFSTILRNPEQCRGIILAKLSQLLPLGHVELAPIMNMQSPTLLRFFAQVMQRCCNPSCTAKQIEALLSCTGCQGPQYCSSTCQKACWPMHKPNCKKSAPRPEPQKLSSKSRPQETAAAAAQPETMAVYNEAPSLDTQIRQLLIKLKPLVRHENPEDYDAVLSEGEESLDTKLSTLNAELFRELVGTILRISLRAEPKSERRERATKLLAKLLAQKELTDPIFSAHETPRESDLLEMINDIESDASKNAWRFVGTQLESLIELLAAPALMTRVNIQRLMRLCECLKTKPEVEIQLSALEALLKRSIHYEIVLSERFNHDISEEIRSVNDALSNSNHALSANRMTTLKEKLAAHPSRVSAENERKLVGLERRVNKAGNPENRGIRK